VAERQRRGPRGSPRGVAQGGDRGRAARPGQARRAGQSHSERLLQEDRAQQGRRAAEHGDGHDSRRVAVLEVRPGGIPEAARIQPRLPSVQGMLITDAQVHIWAADTPERPWPGNRSYAHRPESFLADELLKEMDSADVARVVIVPPSWEGDRNDLALEAARLHRDRFG